MNVAIEQYFIHSFHFITKNILHTPAQKWLKKKKMGCNLQAHWVDMSARTYFFLKEITLPQLAK